jgi:hypothetical protein
MTLTVRCLRANLSALMKLIPAISIAAVLGMVSCETMNAPISSGDFDPLRTPGSGTASPDLVDSGFKPGQFVRAAIPNTAFYNTKPKEGAEANKLLPQHTQMKVVSSTGTFLKVELDSGEVGFVPSVMVEDPNSSETPMGAGGGFSVYPPLPEVGPVEPLPIFDATELPPDGAIPTVIDPDAPLPPSTVAPVPPQSEPTAPPPTDALPPATPPATQPPKTESIPLPPSDIKEDEE